MNIVIDISTESSGGKRSVSFNGELSYHIREIELQAALKESNFNFWKNDIANGTGLGQQLYKFLNGSGGQLDSIIEESRQSSEQLSLYLQIPYDINSLPFELLYNSVFLAQQSHPRIYIIRKVVDRHGREKHTPEPRPLKVLFMACSPLDYRSHEVLEFEKEEDKILSSVERFPVDVITEDLGSLTGLYERLYEDGPFDVVHITGHAGHDYELGPVFYIEDEIGRLDKVTPERLWDEALRHFAPRLLFLSGCSTGKSDKVNCAESFAYCMVEKGVPLVLGWGLPVTDMGATLMTTKLYEYLGMGQGITEALANSRQDLEKNYHPWPLLRLFTDGSSLGGFISSGQKIRYAPVRKTRYRMLSEGHVKVLDKGFVGRRREIQKGVRSLRGVPDEKEILRYGILIRGPAGVGKSCLAGKLIERFKDWELIVFHDSLTSEGDILIKFKKLFDRLGETEGLDVIKSDKTYEEKIKELFRNVFQRLSLMIYFDDFEQNLVNQGDYWEIRPDVIRIIRPLLQALDWYETKARMIITSRYPFELEHEGENLYEKLTDITLTSFKDADLRKKCAELSCISASKYKEMYLHYGCGNPRLLEWLEIIAENEEKYDPDSLAQALEGKNEGYIREYLAEFLMEIEGKEFSDFLRQALVFRRPVAQKAFDDIGDVQLLEKGVGLTLFEKEHVAGQDAQYWVNPVIREKQWNKQTESDQKKLHQIALDWYDRIISGSESPDYEYLKEAVYHALASDNIIPACRYSIDLGKYMEQLLLYEDKKNLQKKVADRITKKVIEEATSKKDDNIAELLNNLGITYYTLGEALKAIKYYEKALGIDLKVFGDKHPNVARDYNNLGSAYSYLGEVQKAIEYYEKALGIIMGVYGEYHTYVATTNNNLGSAYRDLGEAQKAIEYYEKALGIFMGVYGEYHPYVAITNNNLGLAYRDLGEAQKAIEYYEKALCIDLKVFGDKHPNVATRYNNLGLAYSDLGQVQKAIEYYEKALC
ncbi:MAG: tetratricopeptide repeat protein, partial [bacterium]